ncbi:hypothetical protein MJG53_001498 [Ovis ammon polii x Ovis aries]|uniref:Uncharacterized protein n=1 Tax=Ovis ammon polii x Ovis aries TaxID=2918886 RepID=A0ACB9VKA6_9CETA|nr:hypothetical protein MJG53_001498 [Ovis ammon polii x Ovis aries]
MMCAKKRNTKKRRGPEYRELGICSTVAHNPGPRGSEAQDSGAHVPLQGIRGGSVLFHVTKKQEADPEEVSWGFGPESNYRVFMRVHRGKDTPTWVSLQDKYQQRVHVPNVTSLRIENLTPEDSGQYRARASFTGGREFTQVFRLTVNEPVILPEILVKSSSITPGWCNVTLECKSPGNREELKDLRAVEFPQSAGFYLMLECIHSTGVKSSVTPGPGVQDSGAHVPMQGIQGGSVLFHVTKKQEADPEEVSWGFGSESNYRVFMRVHRGKDTPTWVSLQDKYQHRVHVPSVTSLRIENLTQEDSGHYRARASFTRGIEFNQVFLLAVYDPVPLPQILVKSASITPGWCNATLECTASQDTEDLKVTWGSMGLPRGQRITLDPPSNPWTLTLSLPLSQPSASLTCVVSNQVDQKTATLDLGEVCVSGVCCTGVKSSVAPDPGVQDSGVHIPLQGIRGGSVLFHVPKKQEAEPEEVSWGFGPESNYRVFMRVHRGKDTPTWVSLQDKYQQRVHVPNVTSLRIENLIPEDSGQYRARASFIGGIEFTQVFRLTVYDPAPLPHILVKSASFTAGWCNATLKCTAPGDTEDLKVTWEIKGLPKELEQRVTSKLPSNSWNLTLNLPLSQPNGSLTCVVSNQVGQKTATLDLGEVCVSGVEFQDDQRDNDGGVQYAELNQQGSGEVTNKGAGKRHLEEKEPGTLYSEVYKPERGAMKII